MRSYASVKKARAGKPIGIWVVIILIFMAELFAYTWCRVQCISTGYRIANETENLQRAMMMQKNLRVELARLKSPDRVARIATTKLELAMPEPGQIVVIQ